MKTIRASSLPALAQCPCFVGQSSEFTAAGTDRHKCFAEYVRTGDPSSLDFLDEEEAEKVKWAGDIVLAAKAVSGLEFVQETRMETDFAQIMLSGTPDVFSGAHIWDLKWRERDYELQVAAYVILIFATQKDPGSLNLDTPFPVDLLFAEQKKVASYSITPFDAMCTVGRLIKNLGTEPKACDYCGWCANASTCPALVKKAGEVANSVAPRSWDPDKITTPEQVAEAYEIATEYLAPWIEAIKERARKLVDAGCLPGYTTETTQGNRYVADVLGAYSVIGLPSDVFLAACDVRLNTSKKYPDKKGLIDLIKERQGGSLESVKRQVMAQLGHVIKRGSDKVSIVKIETK